jgi:hypothetical protein
MIAALQRRALRDALADIKNENDIVINGQPKVSKLGSGSKTFRGSKFRGVSKNGN